MAQPLPRFGDSDDANRHEVPKEKPFLDADSSDQARFEAAFAALIEESQPRYQDDAYIVETDERIIAIEQYVRENHVDKSTMGDLEHQEELESDFPAAFAALESIFNSTNDLSILERLNLAQSNLQSLLAESVELQQLAEHYINRALSLNQSYPFATTIKKAFDYFEREATTSGDDQETTVGNDETHAAPIQGTWVPMELPAEVFRHAYEPVVQVECTQGGQALFYITMCLYNQAGGDYIPEIIRVPVHNLGAFSSTLPAESLLSQALPVFDRSLLGSLSGGGEAIDSEELEAVETPPEKIAELMALETALGAAKIIIDGHNESYASYQQAYAATLQMLTEELQPLFSEIDFTAQGYHVRLSGPGVVVPNIKPYTEADEPDDDNDEAAGNAISQALHPNLALATQIAGRLDERMPVTNLQFGDMREGRVSALVPVIDKATYNGSEQYRPGAGLIVLTGMQTVPLASAGKVELLSLTSTANALVLLNDMAEIKLVELDEYREVQAQLERVKKEADSFEAPLRVFADFFVNGVRDDAYVDFPHLPLLKQLSADIVMAFHQGTRVKSVLQALDTLFVNRTCTLETERFVKRGNEYVPGPSLDDSEFILATIMDVTQDASTGEVMFVLEGDKGPEYVPLVEIQNWKF